jgi:DNA repair and recombination protein RAD52
MFSAEQRAELAKPLNKAHVKPPAPGKYGDYIEGWRVIDEANRIFGFDGWTRETVSISETWRELVELTGKNGPYKQWRVGYMAKVRVTAGGVVREGTGFGAGQSKPDNLGDAIESAAKEAETDAMKRALMTFGNPFGLALYDKSQANVSEPAIDDAQYAELVTLIETAGIGLELVLQAENLPKLLDLPASRFADVRRRLNVTISENSNTRKAA